MATDYERIAEKYDADRPTPGPNAFLAARLEATADRPFTVLDIGCGTGSWLLVQSQALFSQDVRWLGLDPSPAMLAQATTKLSMSPVRLVRGVAEAIPCSAGSVHHCVSNLSFHHFVNKRVALDEVRRVSQHGGSFAVLTLGPELMPGWWVYRFFPDTVERDRERFWTADVIRAELERRGWEVEIDVQEWIDERSVRRQLGIAERRTTSQLDILDDHAYERGLERMRALVARDPEAIFENEGCFVRVRAQLRDSRGGQTS